VSARSGQAAGALNVRLVLEAPSATPDGAGGEEIEWQAVASLWAELTPLSGGETLAFDRSDPSVRWRVRFRYRNGVTPDMRLRLGERVMEIRAVYDPDGAGRAFLECLAEERGQ
jgi:SPP1 family predicted phage head-tail adaptor